MSAPLVFAFCQEAERQTVRDACEAAGIAPPWFEKVPRPLGVKPRLILLAIGPEGGAALARWVDSHGLNGVVGVGLAGVTAPWAERRSPLTQTLEESDAGRGAPFPLPLGPIEPLRAVAERARAGVAAGTFSHTIHFAELDGPVIGSTVKADRAHPLRIVIACAPDDGVCGVCLGERRVVGAQSRVGPSQDPLPQPCPGCSGTGKALSSADVSAELLGQGGDTRWEMAVNGGVSAQMYQTRAELDKHGLAAVLKAVGP